MPSDKVAPRPTEWEPHATVEIDLKSLNPDADGDGKITQQERDIYNALKAADIDGSGSIGLVELCGFGVLHVQNGWQEAESRQCFGWVVTPETPPGVSHTTPE